MTPQDLELIGIVLCGVLLGVVACLGVVAWAFDRTMTGRHFRD